MKIRTTPLAFALAATFAFAAPVFGQHVPGSTAALDDSTATSRDVAPLAPGLAIEPRAMPADRIETVPADVDEGGHVFVPSEIDSQTDVDTASPPDTTIGNPAFDSEDTVEGVPVDRAPRVDQGPRGNPAFDSEDTIAGTPLPNAPGALTPR